MINHSEGLEKELIKTCFDNLKGFCWVIGPKCRYGIGGEILQVCSFRILTPGARCQVVSVNSAVSVETWCGPWSATGIRPGAAYFLIMVNDLTDGRIALLFADDTTAVPGVIVLSRL